MIARIGVGLCGAAIGAVLGWTISAFTHWPPAIVVVAIIFGLLAFLNDVRESPSEVRDRNKPTRLFPPDENEPGC